MNLHNHLFPISTQQIKQSLSLRHNLGETDHSLAALGKQKGVDSLSLTGSYGRIGLADCCQQLDVTDIGTTKSLSVHNRPRSLSDLRADHAVDVPLGEITEFVASTFHSSWIVQPKLTGTTLGRHIETAWQRCRIDTTQELKGPILGSICSDALSKNLLFAVAHILALRIVALVVRWHRPAEHCRCKLELDAGFNTGGRA